MTSRMLTEANAGRDTAPKASGMSAAFSLAIAAVLFAVFSRLAVRYLGVPAAINFMHFPLALGAFIVAPPPVSAVARRTAVLIGAFAGVVLVSGLLAGTEPLRMMLAWLVWVEPVLVLYVVYVGISPSYPGHAKRQRAAVVALITMVLAQFVFMTTQIPLRAFRNDGMQGTFVGGQTAAHLAPAVALLGSFAMLSFAVVLRGRPFLRIGLVSLASYGFLLTLLGKAHAVLITGIAAVTLSILARTLLRPKRMQAAFAGLVVVTLLVVGVSVLLPRLGTAPSTGGLERGFLLKAYAPARILEEMERDPTVAVFGQGPGTSISRVALESQGGVIGDSAPHAVLGLQATDFTREMVAFRGANPLAGSSLFQPWSSFLGIAGDLGMLGLVAYAAMWWPLVRCAYKTDEVAHLTVAAVVVFVVALGGQQVYLEDPGFILPAGLLIAVGAAVGLGTTSGSIQPHSLGRV